MHYFEACAARLKAHMVPLQRIIAAAADDPTHPDTIELLRLAYPDDPTYSLAKAEAAFARYGDEDLGDVRVLGKKLLKHVTNGTPRTCAAGKGRALHRRQRGAECLVQAGMHEAGQQPCSCPPTALLRGTLVHTRQCWTSSATSTTCAPRRRRGPWPPSSWGTSRRR